MVANPITRNKNLQPLSREHHYGLLLCWKIRTSFRKNIEPHRVRKYADWFYHNHLLPHFEIEEKFVFPVLGNEHELVIKALAEHRRLKRLFEDTTDIFKSLNIIEEELEKHIRFEERTLFNEIQKIATSDQLVDIERCHIELSFCENNEDKFWD